MEIRSDKLRLLNFIERAQKGEIVLPRFQRNFVWSREDIADLLLSIMKGYYIGSLLFLETDRENNPFGVRPLAGVDLSESQLAPKLLILDGQQRLTSIYYALYTPDIPVKWAKYPYRFFIDLKKIINGDENQWIFSERADYCQKYYDEENQFNDLIIPFSELMNWSDWENSYEDWLIEKGREEHDLYRKQHKKPLSDTIQTFLSFQVPFIELEKIVEDDQDGIAEVCSIFEKINSTGINLSVFDLLTARLYKYGIDLHQLWQQAIEEHQLLNEFSNGEPDMYGIFLLRIIALLRGKDVRAKYLINLDHQGFERDWKKATNAIEKALKRVVSPQEDGFGVFMQKWQPYSTLVPVLAVLLDHAEHARDSHKLYQDIKCWYWGSVFLERYAGAVESLTNRDAVDLLKRSENPEATPQIFSEIRQNILENPGFSLRDVTRVNSIYRGIMNIVAMNGAKDFQANDNISFHELDDHHIFPKAYLQKKLGIKGDEANTILNKTLITSKTNRTISKKAPSDYIKNIIPEAHREEILRSHLIGPEAQKAMETDDYPAFLAAREKDILDAIKKFLEPAR